MRQNTKPLPSPSRRIWITQGVFDDIFKEYTASHDLVCVRTTNMGSLFRLTYHVTLRDVTKEKEMIDKLRCRNGNLEISVSRQESRPLRSFDR